MMTSRLLPILAVLATGAAATPAVAQVFQAAPEPVYTRDPSYPPGGYRPDDPRLATGAIGDADDEDDARAPAPAYGERLMPPAPVGGTDDGYQRAPAPAPVYTDRAPQGPVMSPEDPRYGRLGEPPAVIYGDRPAAARVYGDRDDPYVRGMRPPEALGGSVAATPASPQGGSVPPGPVQLSALPPEERPEVGPAQLEPRLRRQEVTFVTKEPPGTIVVDTSNTYLYYVLGNNRAMRYGVRVGRDGFTWTGVQKVTRKAEWPDWHPPSEMIERQPYLPRFMAGGDGNPMGARAMYLGSTVYRIHGTNQPSTIGKFVSSGCIGMLNDDVSDLYERVKVGTRVVVLPGGNPAAAQANAAGAASQARALSPQASVAPVPPAPLPGTQPSTVAPLPAPLTVR
jgi:lipoprotein-anchoring transpeptidase ErfK/SrfK